MDRLRVLSLNIWNRQEPWERRREIILREVRALEPDLIGLQEVLQLSEEGEGQGRDLARELGYEFAFGSAMTVGGGHFGNAVLARHPIADVHRWELPGIPDLESRALLCAMVETPAGRVPFLVTHLAWRLHHGFLRCRQVSFIAERVAELSATGSYPPILVGDFNAEPESDEIRFLRGWHVIDGRSCYLGDCFHLVGEGSGVTFARRNSFAATCREPDRRLDYIFVGRPEDDGRGEPLAARVVLDRPDGDGYFASDHFGMWAELRA